MSTARPLPTRAPQTDTGAGHHPIQPTQVRHRLLQHLRHRIGVGDVEAIAAERAAGVQPGQFGAQVLQFRQPPRAQRQVPPVGGPAAGEFGPETG